MLKYVGGVLGLLALCSYIWLSHPAREQVKQLEGQISNQYISASYLLRNTVEELQEWNFSQRLTDEDRNYFRKLSNEFHYVTDILLFGREVVHWEWRNRTFDIQRYLNNYESGRSLSDDDVDDLHQALQATYFISMDLVHTRDIYDAMHDEHHEMVEKVKSRLATDY